MRKSRARRSSTPLLLPRWRSPAVAEARANTVGPADEDGDGRAGDPAGHDAGGRAQARAQARHPGAAADHRVRWPAGLRAGRGPHSGSNQPDHSRGRGRTAFRFAKGYDMAAPTSSWQGFGVSSRSFGYATSGSDVRAVQGDRVIRWQVEPGIPPAEPQAAASTATDPTVTAPHLRDPHNDLSDEVWTDLYYMTLRSSGSPNYATCLKDWYEFNVSASLVRRDFNNMTIGSEQGAQQAMVACEQVLRSVLR